MKLRGHSQVPPGQFRYRHPNSGFEMIRHAWDLLRSDVTAHCSANGFPPITDEEIERQMCENMGEEPASRYCEGDGLTVKGVGLHWKEIAAGTKALISHVLSGRQTVEQEEAERRAAICVTCERNVEYHRPCGGRCPEVDEVVKAVVGGGTTSLDDKLKACSVCGCVNRAAVWVEITHLSKGIGPDFVEKAPPTCWKRIALHELAQKSV